MLHFLQCLFITVICLSTASAQRVEGIWSGKISRSSSIGHGVESLDVQLYQSGRSVWGSTFVFKDSARFVLFRAEGRRNKKDKTLELSETGTPIYLLPRDFFPCSKIYTLQWYKVGRTQYLAGKWSGMGIDADTSCFPGEDLVVVLQKVKDPEYSPEQFLGVKLTSFFQKMRKPDTDPDTLAPAITDPAPAITEPAPAAEAVEDKTLANRKQDIQHILTIKDSLAHIVLYDNAIVDDDTVTIFVNKKPVLVKERLTDKGLHFDINLNSPDGITEIIMQAENLGSIPPNTALMVITYDNKRYEARLRAGFEKHAVIVITRAPD